MATATTYKPISWIFFRSEDVTYWGQIDKLRMRARSIPKNPRTADQTASRGFLGEAKRQWSTLSAADKKAWSDFARENLDINKREQMVTWRGIDAFVRASISRQTAGLSSMPALPQGMRPLEPTGVSLLPGANARELVLQIAHETTNLEGHALLIRMTPTGKNPTCTPYKSSLRYVRGVGPDSLIALPKSDETIRIADTQFELVPGCTYAVEVRILRLADGAVSDPRYQSAKREVQPVQETQAGVHSVRQASTEPAARPSTDEQARPVSTTDVSTKSTSDKTLDKLTAQRGSPDFPSFYIQNKYFT